MNIKSRLGKAPVQNNRKKRGFVLVTMAVVAVAMVGAMGVGIDVGRMFITKHEIQAFADSAALGAVLALDGTTTGITSAQAAVTGSANTWNFNSSSVSSPTIAFATASTGPWVSSPNPAS